MNYRAMDQLINVNNFKTKPTAETFFIQSRRKPPIYQALPIDYSAEIISHKKRLHLNAAFQKIYLLNLSFVDRNIFAICFTCKDLTRATDWISVFSHFFPLCNPSW